LIELLVVVGIIAILIATVITVVAKVRRAAYGAATSAQLSAISSAIQQYYGDFKAYPGPLANNQLGMAYGPSGAINYASAQGSQLTAIKGITIGTTQLQHITGAQNLVLGLLGGLEYNVTQYPSAPFYYNPLDIFPDGSHPGPVGASNLSGNANNARRQISYIQVKQGDISLPSMSFNGGTGASFADAANRSPSDAPIPVFLDKYPDPMPIIYIRTNPSGQAIVGIRNSTTINGSSNLYDDSQSAQNATQIAETPQYDLCQILDYTLPNPNNPVPASLSTLGFTGGFFGVNYSSLTPYHGLQGLGDPGLNTGTTVDSIGTTMVSTQAFYRNGYANKGQNAVAYFRDPTFVANQSSSYNPLASNTHAGVPREKDGFLLITSGPDRAYGTTDDIIFPGTLLPQQ
jgi:Tfp pilus assembly protein PilE